MSPARVTRDANPLRDVRDGRLPRIPGPCCIVMFGVTGDLARKKLLPAIYDLFHRGLLPPGFSLIGFARRDWDDDTFKGVVRDAVESGARTGFDEVVWDGLVEGLRFVQGTFDDDAAFDHLAQVVDDLEEQRGTGGNTAFYLSVPPRSFRPVCEQLDRSGLSRQDTGRWRRVVIEKPFGHDLSSARELNGIVESVFPPDTVFRIDHYLGKETVQNILALRFANQLFEPVWNRHYVDHVQITMAEDIGIGGRAGYYDGIGAARDVLQNHLLQLMALTAMEQPNSFDADALRTEKEKVLAAVRLPRNLIRGSARGRYGAGWQGSEKVHGYLDEDGVEADSITETYAAVRLEVHSRRWDGVPFYLRTGKRLGKRVTEIAVVFAPAPAMTDDAASAHGRNAIVIRVQPDEGITMRFGSKVPGTTGLSIRDVTMDFGYGNAFTESSPEAYERLILDVLLGDPPLFPRHEEVELSWKILDPFERAWARHGAPETYAAGSWGPQADLMRRDGRRWRLP